MSAKKATTVPTQVQVILRSIDRPAIKGVGQYQPDRPYTVSIPEACRLVQFKGFSPANEADAQTIQAALTAAQQPKEG